MAGHYMAAAHIRKLRLYLAANVFCIGTSGVEPASRGWIDGAWNIPLNAAALFLSCQLWISHWNTLQQSFGIRMKGMFVNIICLADFHQLS